MCLFAQNIGIALTGFGKIDDLCGESRAAAKKSPCVGSKLSV
jgi:hypothetical protein